MLVIFSLIMAVAYALFDQTRPTDCPAAGFVTYENRRVLRDNQFFTFAKVDGIDDCYRQCISHLECGFFEIPLAGVCLMYPPEFKESNLTLSFAFKVGVPCERKENSTEAPTEPFTESTAAPNDCPADCYFKYPISSISASDRIAIFFHLSGQGIDVGEFCNAACRSRSDCGFFQVDADNGTCRICRGTFDESLVANSPRFFVGVPCCPVQGYVIYSGNAIRSPDLLLDIVELGQEEGGDNCNAECSLRRECGYFHVEDNNCVMFRGPFHQSLLSSDAAVFVGVPCGMENPTGDPSESPTEASTEAPTRAPTLAPTRPTAGPNDCPAEGFFRYPTSLVGMTEQVFAFYFFEFTRRLRG